MLNLIQKGIKIYIYKIFKSAQENFPCDKNNVTIHIKHTLYAPFVHRPSGREVHNLGRGRGKNSLNHPKTLQFTPKQKQNIKTKAKH